MKYIYVITLLTLITMTGCSTHSADDINNPNSVSPYSEATVSSSEDQYSNEESPKSIPSPPDKTIEDDSSLSIEASSSVIPTGGNSETYADGFFTIQLLDSNHIPVINAQISVNLDWEWHRTFVTNADGEITIFLPQYSTEQFIDGEYEFEITQDSLDKSAGTELIKSTLTETDSYPIHQIKLSNSSTAEQIRTAENIISMEIQQNGKPMKNIWIGIDPVGTSWPEGNHRMGSIEAYTDNTGNIYFTDIPAGEYSVGLYKSKDSVQITNFSIDIDEVESQSTISLDENYEVLITYN